MSWPAHIARADASRHFSSEPASPAPGQHAQAQAKAVPMRPRAASGAMRLRPDEPAAVGAVEGGVSSAALLADTQVEVARLRQENALYRASCNRLEAQLRNMTLALSRLCGVDMVDGGALGADGPPALRPMPSDTPHETGAHLAMLSAQLAGAAAVLAHAAAAAAMAPVQGMYSALHADVEHFVCACAAEARALRPLHHAAIARVKALAAQLWPRANVQPFGSFDGALQLPSSDLDLVVTLPPVRASHAMSEAAGVLEGRTSTKESWQQSMARALLLQEWVLPDSLRTVDSAIPIISFETRPHAFSGAAAVALGVAARSFRIDISFEGANHNGLSARQLMKELANTLAPFAELTLVLKQFVHERHLDKPYSGGLSSYGLALLVARFVQDARAHPEMAVDLTSGPRGGPNLGALLVKLLDFYGSKFSARTMGVSVLGEGRYIHRVEPNAQWPPAFAWASTMQAPPGGRSSRHYARAASEAGDGPPGGMQGGAMMPYHAAPNQLPMQMGYVPQQPQPPWQQAGQQEGGEEKCWFDPLYIEDPLRPLENNVGRNCFRINQIQQAFAEAYTELLHRGSAQASGEHRRQGSVLALILSAWGQ
ncbi:hypothetical protein T492DRAFT_982214 [Pavlovales sp. CCMP2436]|nr:hypothetical protein T492DRAFT_982214 [Pavlovales sp. CCMP2436]